MEFVGLNTLDLLFLLLLFVGMMIGFVRGAVSQIVSMVAVWLGLVATLWLYRLVSERILQNGAVKDMFNLSKIAADTLAFMVLLAVFFIGFNIIIKKLAVPPEEKKKKRKKDTEDPLAEAARTTSERVMGCVNAIGGIAMGLVLTVLWLALLVGVLQFIFQDTGTQVPYTGFSRNLVRNMHTSLLLPWFNQVLWGLATSVRLFIPKNADIFEVVLRQLLTTSGG
jgi:hypothetical protein